MKNFLMIFFVLAAVQFSNAFGENNRKTHELLHAVLWTQAGGEYEATCKQAYNMAQFLLEDALALPDWTAAVEQEGTDYTQKPPAIILDVDETVLDNSAYEASLIHNESHFEPESWSAWIKESKAAPVPGALEFTKYAAEKGVKVFYVTNRNVQDKEGTQKNLQKFNFPFSDNPDHILTKKENKLWGSDKKSRREHIAENHRIIFLFGDDLNDFVSGTKYVTTEERNAVMSKYADRFGQKWFILPNPQYGGWERAFLHNSGAETDEENLRIKYKKLNSWK